MLFFRFNKHTGEATVVEPEAKKKAAKPVSKQDIIAFVARSLKLPKNEVDNVVTSALTTIAATLKDGRAVRIAGFGKFKPRKARTGKVRNPRTGKKVAAPNRKSVSFRPSLSLRQSLG